jgi:hypothetical protein
MERLRPGWFLHGLWDEEYQRYRLLAYLKHVQVAFFAQRLYPPLSDLIESYEELRSLAQAQQATAVLEDSTDTLYRIIQFAIPKLEESIQEGQQIYDLIAQHLKVEVVGLIPLYKAEGYLFLRRGGEKVVRAYRYEIRPIQDKEGLVGIRLEPVEEFVFSILATPFTILRERLLKAHKDLPTPLTLVVESPLEVPLRETLLPIIKRNLPRWIAHLPPQGTA